MTDLRAYYRHSLGQRIATLEALLGGVAEQAPESVETVRRIAHTLKGTGTSYGFPEVTETARKVLAASDEELAPRLDALLEVLRRVAAGSDDTEAASAGDRPSGATEEGCR